MGHAGDGVITVLAGELQKQGGQPGRDALEGNLLEAGFSLFEAAAEFLKDAQGHHGLGHQQPFHVLPAHDQQHAVLGSLGKGVVHALANEGHFAKDGAGGDGADHQFLAVGGDTVELNPAFFEQEEDLAGILGHVEDPAAAGGAHGGGAIDLLDLFFGQILKDVDHLQVADFAGAVLRHDSPPSVGSCATPGRQIQYRHLR